ncbi:tetratricopeptide repeat protein, partial [bacterium]|nr:tetratricopeptide repeat protein [bacterium]
QLRAIERLKRAGQMEAALDQAQDAHRAHATDADVTLALAQLLVDAQRPREALDLLRRAGGSLPDRAQMLRVEAGAHAGLGDAEAMRRSIGQLRGLAAARAGPLAAVLLLRARLELQLGNRAQALVALERAERLSPSQATLLQIARLAEQLGATARAQTAYRELLRDAPDNVNYQQAFVRTGGQLPIR